MPRPAVTGSALAVAALVLLSGCGVLGSADEPDRDELGAVTEAASSDVMALEVGDCLDSADLATEIEEVPFVPCDEPHDSEVYASVDLEGSAYPGSDAVVEKADAFCYAQFASFVGTSYEESELEFFPIYPLEDGWDLLDDREVQCVVFVVHGTVTGTLRGATR